MIFSVLFYRVDTEEYLHPSWLIAWSSRWTKTEIGLADARLEQLAPTGASPFILAGRVNDPVIVFCGACLLAGSNTLDLSLTMGSEVRRG